MLSWLIAKLPAGWIRWIGHLQFTIPIVGPFIGWFGRKVLASQGTIRYGIGKGLKFDAKGGTAGYLFGTAEPHEQDALARHLKPGDVFYDVGANVGFYATLAAHLVGGRGQVYAFEPNPTCSSQVRRNAELNGFAHVEVVEAAVSSSSGRTRLRLGNITGASTIMRGAESEGIEVALTSVDDFVRERSARAPTLVMIDVEGAEIEVLKGMRETIGRHSPIIMCEVHWIGAEFLEYCHEHLVPRGYTVEPLEGEQFPTEPLRFQALLTPRHRAGLGSGDGGAPTPGV